MKKFILILFCIFSIQSIGIGQTEGIIDNDRIFTALLREGLSKLTDILTISGKDKIYLVKSPDKDKKFEYLVMNIRRIFPEYKFITGEINVKPDYKLLFNNLSLKTNYKNTGNNPVKEKEVIREMTVNYIVNLTQNDSSVYSDVFMKKYEDKIPFDNIPEVEYGAEDFAKGEIPESSFGEKLFIPIIVTAVSAIAVILFYSIRSK